MICTMSLLIVFKLIRVHAHAHAQGHAIPAGAKSFFVCDFLLRLIFSLS